MIKLRIDVDYPYPSRAKSFLCIALGIKTKNGSDYLQNSRIIARMINESKQEIKAYWFFTPYTIPDKRLLNLLNPQKHEVSLHVATNPDREWKILENETNRTVQHYTIHGTQGRIARLIWGRKLSQSQAFIPSDFPLKSFHNVYTFGLDAARSHADVAEVTKATKEWISKDYILSIHPEWLFSESKRSHRGSYYEVLKNVLEVDGELNNFVAGKRAFGTLVHDYREYEVNAEPTADELDKLSERNFDIYTFIERKWCCSIPKPPKTWVKTEENVGLLEVKTYDDWLQQVGKKTRNMIRKAEKSGVTVAEVETSDQLAEGISKIYNETPIRQERAFSHYLEPLETVRGMMYLSHRERRGSFIGAYLENELVGFIQLTQGDNVVTVSNILSLQEHWDKALNNALLAKAVEVCATNGQRWLMYGRMGNHPSLDKFKDSNGFVKYPVNRYYVALTSRGQLIIRLGLQREFKDAIPEPLKGPLIPALNWISRTKIKAKLKLRQRR